MAFFCKSILKTSLCKNLCDSFRNYAARKRFYKNVHITESDGKFEINLDKRKLKTPMGNLLQLPNEALAVAVATEWDIQGATILQQNMHITSLCNTALDNPCQETKETLSESALQFLASDTLCFRSNDPQDLVELQDEKWNPLLKWFEYRYKVDIKICQDVSSTPVTEQGIQEIKRQLLSFNDWCLIGIHFAAENLKSLILTFAVINHKVDIDMAVALSRLETQFQVNRWGNVEWSHDIDKAQTTSRVAAAALFVYLNESSTNNTQKLSTTKERTQKIKASL